MNKSYILDKPLLGYKIVNTDRTVSVEWIQKKLNRIYNDQYIAEDNLLGDDTLNLIRRFQRDQRLVPDGVVGKDTFNALIEKDPFKDAKVLSGSTITGKGTIDNIVESYKNNIFNIISSFVDIIQGSADVLADLISSDIEKNKKVLEYLGRVMEHHLPNYNPAMKQCKSLKAELDHIMLRLNELKNNAAWRNFFGFPGPTESIKFLNNERINNWKKCSRIVAHEINKYKIRKKAESLFNKYSINNELNRQKLSKMKITGSPVISVLITLYPLIWCLCTYEETDSWKRELDRTLYALFDQLLVIFISALVPLIIAALVAAGVISAPAAGVVALISLVVGMIGGIIIWILEDSNIYLSEYLQGFTYSTTYKLLY